MVVISSLGSISHLLWQHFNETQALIPGVFGSQVLRGGKSAGDENRFLTDLKSPATQAPGLPAMAEFVFVGLNSHCRFLPLGHRAWRSKGARNVWQKLPPPFSAKINKVKGYRFRFALPGCYLRSLARLSPSFRVSRHTHHHPAGYRLGSNQAAFRFRLASGS